MTARGRQLKAVRRTVVSLMASGIVAAGVLGLGVVDPLASSRAPLPGDTSQEVATGRPGSEAGDGLGPTATEPGSTRSTIDEGSATTAGDTGTAPSITDGSDSPDGPETTEGSSGSTPASTSPRSTSGPATTDDPGAGPVNSPTTAVTTTETPGSTGTTEPIAVLPPEEVPPSLGVVRMRAGDATETWSGVCHGLTRATVAVEIEEATSAVVSWNYGSGTRSVPMQFDGNAWVAPLDPFKRTALDSSATMILTVMAQGPGGTAHTAATLTLTDCDVGK